MGSTVRTKLHSTSLCSCCLIEEINGRQSFVMLTVGRRVRQATFICFLLFVLCTVISFRF